MSSPHAEQRRRPPPLRAVQAFAAAARHMSLTRAADELAVTQSAVSRQVRELERNLGVALFERRGRNLALTANGRAFARVAADAIDRLTNAGDELRRHQDDPVVTLSMLPSVAARWLAPRLGDFVEAHPDIDLRITAARRFVDFAGEGVDAAIRYGRGEWSGVTATRLGGESIAPVCSPTYAERLGLRQPGDLVRATLLHGDLPDDWRDWLGAAGVSDLATGRGLRFGDDNALLQAAVDGLGVALGRSLLVADDLCAGRLVAPFAERIPASFEYWFVVPVSHRAGERLERVRGWLAQRFAG